MNCIFKPLTLIASLISIVAPAQKIDLDKVSIKNEYITLPEDGTLLPYNTYSVNFKIDEALLTQLDLTASKLTAYGTLNGFGYNSGAGEFVYTLIIEKPITLPGLVEERVNDVKSTTGQMTKVTKYVGKLRQAIPTTILLTDRATSKQLYKREFGKTLSPYEIPSQEFDNKVQAEAFTNVKDGELNPIILNNYKKRLEADIQILQRTFSTQKKETRDAFWELNLKKTPEYAPFNQELAKAKVILENQSYNASLEQSRQAFAPILKYWSENVTTVRLDDPKTTKKLKYAYLINLAKSQFWLEWFDASEKTCQQLIANDYEKEDAQDLLKAIAKAKTEIKSAGVNSRHFYRKGFEETSKFDYGTLNKTDRHELKASIEDVKKTVKEDFVRKDQKDTLAAYETDLSDFKCTFKGNEIGLKHNQLQNGSGSGLPLENGVYAISFSKSETLLPISRTVESFNLNLYPNISLKEGFDADDMLALLKEYDQKTLLDINTGNDTIGYYVNGQSTKSKTILPKDYPQKLSIEARIKLNFKDNSDLSGTYVTHTGDQFKIQLVEAAPVNIGARAAYLKSKGYLVTLMIPELTINKTKCIDSWCYLTGETILLQNVMCRFLMLSR